MTLLEVPVDSVASLEAARRGGAARLELCADLTQDGLTPESELVRYALAPRERIPAFAMVRPRAGDFRYSASEIDGMCATARELVAAGVDGIVTGVLTADDRVDARATERLVEAARGLPTTFHRAFDRVPDPLAALDELVALGVQRVLTSGGAATAWDGRAMLRRLVDHAAGRIVVLPGGGVRAGHARELVRETGAVELHSSTPFEWPAGPRTSPR